MDYSKEEILAEIRRRKGGDAITQAEAEFEPEPVYSSPEEHMAGIRPAPEGFGKELVTSVVRGIPFANEIGAAAAAVPASFGGDRPLRDVYDEMLSVEEEEERAFAEEYPAGGQFGENVGGALTLGLGGGLTGALAKKGAAALGRVQSGRAGLAGATAAAAKPRVRVAAGGAVEEPVKRLSKEGLKATGAAASVGALVDDDPLVGGLTGATAMNLLFNTPAGRVFTLAMSRKMGGEKITQAAWHSMNPQNRARFWEFFKSFQKKRGSK